MDRLKMVKTKDLMHERVFCFFVCFFFKADNRTLPDKNQGSFFCIQNIDGRPLHLREYAAKSIGNSGQRWAR